MSTTPPSGAPHRWLCALLTAALAAQDPVPPVDPALPDLLKDLKTQLSDKKMALDFQAIGLIQKLTADPKQLNPKDKDRLAKALGDVFRTGKLRTPDKDLVYREAGLALAKLDLDGSKQLLKVLEDKRLEDNVPLRGHLLEALGKTKDDKQVEYLVDVATRDPHDELRASAGTALGEFTELEVKARREAVKALIREWGSLHQKATQPESSDPSAPIDFGPQNARKTLQAIEGKWVATLTKLTGMTMSGFQDWQRWLNKNPNWNPPQTK